MMSNERRRVRRFTNALVVICALETLKRQPVPTVYCDECGEEKPETDCEEARGIGIFCSACRATRECGTCSVVFAWKWGDDECTCGDCAGHEAGLEAGRAEGYEAIERGLELAQWVVDLFASFDAQGVDFELTDLFAKHGAEAIIKAHRVAAAERQA